MRKSEKLKIRYALLAIFSILHPLQFPRVRLLPERFMFTICRWCVRVRVAVSPGACVCLVIFTLLP